mgnify:CR=1 FL=1|jgi:hypothetical protein
MAIISISTQYHENYSDTDTPYWKPKGEVKFQVEISYDILMYCNNLEKILTEMIAEESNDFGKYTYLSHDVSPSQPEELCSDKLRNRIANEDTWDDGHALDQVVDEMLKSEIDIPGFESTLDELDILCDIKTITDDYASKHLNKN